MEVAGGCRWRVAGSSAWLAYDSEDQDAAYAPGPRAGQDPAQPTKVDVGGTDDMQLSVCPASPERPNSDLVR